jgi:hypothetical protein
MGDPEVLIPIIAISAPFGVAIIAMLIKHQQRMVELMHRHQGPVLDTRIDALQRDMAELKDLIHQQALAIDGLSRGSEGPRIEERIVNGR